MMGLTMTITLAVANQKGGVAKTTSVASIGAALAELGQKVLLVDLDPQACLTFSLGIDPEDLDISVHHVLTKGIDPHEVVISTDDGVDLLPATIELARAEAEGFRTIQFGVDYFPRTRGVSTLSSFPVIRTIVREGRQLVPDLRAARRRARAER